MKFTSLSSTMSPVLMSGIGLSFSDASIARLLSIYPDEKRMTKLKSNSNSDHHITCLTVTYHLVVVDEKIPVF